jgi:molecular chaperone DnaJ
MQNPYEVLGVNEGASKDEIKAAYRALVKKYHPDKHQDNPLNDLAEEKMQEINEAYEFLMNGGGSRGSSSGGRSSSGYGSSGYSSSGYGGGRSPEFADIRKAIDRGNIAEAEAKLSRAGNHNAEWHYLYGMVQLRKGWYDQAVGSLQTAVSMDPNNLEYRNAMNSIMNSTGRYAQGGYQRSGYSAAERQMCQLMQCYCCADMCCDCI